MSFPLCNVKKSKDIEKKKDTAFIVYFIPQYLKNDNT